MCFINVRLETNVEILWWVGGWWGLHSHFHVQPNYSVDVVLSCVVVGVVTIHIIFVVQSLLKGFCEKKVKIQIADTMLY